MDLLSIIALLGLVVAVVVTLVGVVTAAQQGRWGILLAIPLLLLGAVIMVTGLSYKGMSEPAQAVVNGITPPPGIPEVPAMPGVPAQFAVAEVASNDELEAIAGAAPKIDLGEAADELTIEQDSPRPDWIEGPAGSHQLVLSTDPYATVETCECFARVQLLEAVGKRAQTSLDSLGDNREVAIAEIEDRFVGDRYLEKREVSVGEVYLMHTLVELDEESVAWLAEKSKRWNRIARRRAGVRNVALGGGGVLAIVALLHGVLRSGGEPKP